jgi:hypothetical protein
MTGRTAVAGVLLMLSAMPTGAGWMKYEETEYGIWYVDLSTLQKNGDKRTVAHLIDWKKSDLEGGMSLRSLREYDCRRAQFRRLSSGAYSGPMGTGSEIRSTTKPDEPTKVLLDSIQETALRLVCSK